METGIDTKFSTKIYKEKKAIKIVLTKYPDLQDLAFEYIEEETPTAKFLKELDKLEMVLQALEYEIKGIKNMQEFWDNAKNYLHSEETIDIFEALKNLRS